MATISAGPQMPAVPIQPAAPASGTAPGASIAPGSEENGWVIPEPVRLSDGTMLQIYKDGQAWHAAFDAIGQAQQRVCLEVYIFASDDVGQAMADLLCKKAREGLAVYVIYDSFGSLMTDRNMFQRMRQAGVRVQEFHPLRPWECRYGWRPVNRDHRKLLCIDNDIAGLGGENLSREYSSSWPIASTKSKIGQNRDNAFGLHGPGAHHLLRSFARSWNYLLRGGRIRRAELIHEIHGGDIGLLASVPTLSSPLQPLIVSLLRGAKKSIQLTMAYFAPDDVLIDELCRAADRGVRVQLMLPQRLDVMIVVTAARSFYTHLMAHGVQIYERTNVILHAKTMVVDGAVSVVGSANLDYRSIETNCEISLVVRNEAFGGQMKRLFDHDIRFAVPIDPDQWRRRPWLDRVGQWAVSRTRYLL
jgi:cardiolipin synthase A/B